MKAFPGQVGKKDYSGFNRSQRTDEPTLDNHKKYMLDKKVYDKTTTE